MAKPEVNDYRLIRGLFGEFKAMGSIETPSIISMITRQGTIGSGRNTGSLGNSTQKPGATESTALEKARKDAVSPTKKWSDCLYQVMDKLCSPKKNPGLYHKTGTTALPFLL